MESIRSGKNDTFVPEHLMIKDPYRIEEQVHFKKKQQGLVDVEFKAWDLVLTGLHNLRIANLHVVRHMNLKDIRLHYQNKKVKFEQKLTYFTELLLKL